jgi:two-component system response regulator AtoC
VSEVTERPGLLRVLVVEDDERLLDILRTHLERLGYSVRTAGNAALALRMLEEAPAEVVISDVRMPGIDGRTLLRIAHERFPDVRIVLMTAFGTVDDAVLAMREGAYTYLTKPFKVDEIAAVLRNVAREVALGREVQGLKRAIRERFSAERLLGASPRMDEVRRALREAAAVDATVLVTGPSGTGKELAARAIHFESPRAAAPFVPVNCAAVPESLFESTMFGHRRGAFTGAMESHTGFVEQAHQGTLFLDEVGEIPLSQQAKLLRVLQEGELQPLGSPRAVQVDIRIIAATNRDLAAMVREGTFREDLWYRINVLGLHLPALRERREDIPALAEHLLVELAGEHGRPALGLTSAALETLTTYAWPGNVRELRNVLERALLRAVGRPVDSVDLPPEVRGRVPATRGPAPDVGGPVATLADVERAHIEAVLARCEWNRSSAARLLDIDRRTLFAKIQRYGLVGPLRRDAKDED